MNTTENNKKIAEFLHGKNAVHPNQYHENWNELMQVVKKIEGLSNDKNVIHWARNNKNIFDIKLTEATKETAYKAVIAFIDWYNEQNKTKQ